SEASPSASFPPSEAGSSSFTSVKKGSTSPASLIVIGCPKRSRLRPAATRIQPSEMLYSSTSWRSLPLKRMPTPRCRVSASKWGLRGLSERRSGGVSVTVPVFRLVEPGSAQLGDGEPVGFRPLLHGLLGPGQCLGDGLQGHALAGEEVQLLQLLALPGLAVAGEMLCHQSFATLPFVEGLAAMVFFTSFLGLRASLLPRTCPLAISSLLD